jgi:hypothetical protein
VSGLDPRERFNRLPEEEAATELLAVCHSRRWAKEVAAGRDATEILAALTGRLGNDPATELRVAADEHRRITRLRLERLMQG